MTVAHDPWRPRFQEAFGGLHRLGPFTLVTTNWTLYEALAVSQRRGKRFATGLFSLVSKEVEIVPVSPEVESEALRQFFAWGDKTASVVDHANTLVALDEECDAILSFDLDFVPLAAAAGIAVVR
jgi:predicted nucleic acid-binding protein